MYCACTALSLRMSVLVSACAALADFLGDIKFLFNFFCIHLVTLNLCETNYFTTFVKVFCAVRSSDLTNLPYREEFHADDSVSDFTGPSCRRIRSD